MSSTLQWQPEPKLLEQLTHLAQQRGQSPEIIVTEAVNLYLQLQSAQPQTPEKDSLIGLFAGSPDLAEQSEAILQQDITPASGWTWKQP